MDQIIPGADKDIVKPLHKRIEGRYEAIHLGAKVTGVEAMKSGLKVAMEGPRQSDTLWHLSAATRRVVFVYDHLVPDQ
jgi:pyruvate/2-oxoglutarate dehydrogenase complex dihydrolipoamide dehydrogenase (E3) component